MRSFRAVILIIILTNICLFYPISSFSKQYQSVHVILTGINNALDKETESLILLGLSIKAAEKEKKLHEDRIENLHQIAPQEITNTLEALGYYHAKIYSKLVQQQDDFYATYQVKLGQPTILKKVSIELKGLGKDNPELKNLIHTNPLKPGMKLSHKTYENFKQALLGLALQLGYLESIFDVSEIRINQDNDSAEICLELNTGPQYRIGEVHFQKNPYPSEYLERYIPWQCGAPYTTKNILDLQKALTDTELFRYVRIDPELNLDSELNPVKDKPRNLDIPLNIRLKPRPQNRYSGSLGYGTDSGPRAMLAWGHRRINYPGHRFNVEVRGSRWKKNADLRYTIPGEKPATDRLVFALRATEEKWRDDKYSLREDLSVTQLKKIGKFEYMLSLHGLIVEKYRELSGFPKRQAHLLIPDGGFIYTNITRTKPSETGFRLSMTLRGAYKPVLSSTSFIQTNIIAKSIFGIGNRTRVILRGELGATAIKNFRDLPLSLRFFTGGDQSVRGFGYRSLGPEVPDAKGNLINIGGRYLAVGSVELEQNIYKEYSAAVFYDTGQAMNKWNTQFARSVGVGVRFQTPLGPLRIDLAQPLNIVGKKKPRIHLTLGMDL